MTKKDAISLFGTTQEEMSFALHGMNRSAVSKWPERLTLYQQDRVIGAAMRLKIIIPDHIMKRFRELKG